MLIMLSQVVCDICIFSYKFLKLVIPLKINFFCSFMNYTISFHMHFAWFYKASVQIKYSWKLVHQLLDALVTIFPTWDLRLWQDCINILALEGPSHNLMVRMDPPLAYIVSWCDCRGSNWKLPWKAYHCFKHHSGNGCSILSGWYGFSLRWWPLYDQLPREVSKGNNRKKV